MNVNREDADASADAAVNDASRNAGNPKGLSSVSPSVNSIRNTYTYSGRRQPQRTASESTAQELTTTTTELPVSPTNSIISSPRPFGYPRRRPTRPTARPTTSNTTSNSTTDNVNDNDNKQTQTDDIASKAKTRPSQVDRPKVSANHSQVVQLELELEPQRTTTIAATPSRSEVVDLNVAGNGDPNLRHDVVSNNSSLSINADDNQTQTKIKYTWRAARPTSASGAPNALDSSDKDSRKYAGKRLADSEDVQSVSYRSRHLNSAELQQDEEAEVTTIASTNARRGYQSINRSSSRTGGSKDASSSTEQKKGVATEEAEEETVSSLSGKRNYQSISRTTSGGSANADEQIHYTALTRDSSGSAHLSEGRSSSFTRNLGVAKTTLNTAPISRGGHISTETVVEDENIAAEIIDDELPVVTRGRTIAPASKPSSEDSNTATEQESKETATDIPAVNEKDLQIEEATTVPAVDIETTTRTTEQETTEGTLFQSSSSTVRPTTTDSTSTTSSTEEPKTTITVATTTATPEQVAETVVEQLAELKPTEQPQRQSLFRTKTTAAPSAETETPSTTKTSTTTEPSTTTRRSLFRNRGSSTTSTSTTSTTTTPTTASTAKIEEEKSPDEVVVTTPLPKRRVIVRGSYRPRKEGDLSSLLAVDANKRARYNHQPDPISRVEQSKSTQQVEGTSEVAGTSEVTIEKVEKQEKAANSEESSKRVKVNSRASIAAVRNRTSSQTESLGNGITRTRTTYVRTLDEGKVVKRVHTKTVQEKPAEYEYVYDEASEPAVSTTPRAITRNRGSVRFQSNDLSSLLALDFASRAQRNKQTQSTVTKTRRRLLKKPKERLEHEEVEEFVYEAGNDVEDDEEQPAPAPTRPSTAAPIQRRTRPTRPSTTNPPTTTPRSTTQRTTPTTTEQSLEVGVEHEASTRRTGFLAHRPAARVTTTTTEASTTTAANVEATTRRVLTFKRPLLTTTTTTTEKPEETSTEAQQTVARNFLKHLTANRTTTTEATPTESTTAETQPTTTTTASASLEITDDLTDLKRQFTSALDNLQSGSQTEVEEATTPENDLKEASSGEKLSLPIYHRRKYYQYVKDSPITYIDKSPAPPDGGSATVDIQKQIHDVFNVSDNGTPSNSLEDGEVDSAEADHRQAMEQAQEINSELSHFLLSTPGSV